jgi:hypothetical protein
MALCEDEIDLDITAETETPEIAYTEKDKEFLLQVVRLADPNRKLYTNCSANSDDIVNCAFNHYASMILLSSKEDRGNLFPPAFATDSVAGGSGKDYLDQCIKLLKKTQESNNYLGDTMSAMIAIAAKRHAPDMREAMAQTKVPWKLVARRGLKYNKVIRKVKKQKIEVYELEMPLEPGKAAYLLREEANCVRKTNDVPWDFPSKSSARWKGLSGPESHAKFADEVSGLQNQLQAARNVSDVISKRTGTRKNIMIYFLKKAHGVSDKDLKSKKPHELTLLFESKDLSRLPEGAVMAFHPDRILSATCAAAWNEIKPILQDLKDWQQLITLTAGDSPYKEYYKPIQDYLNAYRVRFKTHRIQPKDGTLYKSETEIANAFDALRVDECEDQME